MLYAIVASLALLGLVLIGVYETRKSQGVKLYLVVSTPTQTVKAQEMQIQSQINATLTLGVSVTGIKGPINNVPVEFALANPALADLVFDQTALTLTISTKDVGTTELTESYQGVTNVHTLTVTDTVVSVDLFELPALSDEPVPVPAA